MSQLSKLHAGDWVEVKTAQEIMESLGADGTLDGLPFMPEMAEHCGQRFRVQRFAEKTCLDFGSGIFRTRVFHDPTLLLLDGIRCTGKDHDDCRRLCTIFWKETWLRKVDGDQPRSRPKAEATRELRSRLKTKSAPDRYFCQSTQLFAITDPLTRRHTISQIRRDLRSRSVGFFEMVALIIVPLLRKFRDRTFGRPRLLGTLKRTPVEHLGLKPGEVVEVKSLQEMQATLDCEGRNRGLVCDIELNRYCGKRFRVLNRLDRMISESSGEMKPMEATVMLEGVPCLCAWSVGGCPRQDFGYFREIWLKRVHPQAERVVDVMLDTQPGVMADPADSVAGTQNSAHGEIDHATK